MKIDMHVHLAGLGTNGSGCWMSPSFQRRIVFRYLRWRFGITGARMRDSIDADWARAIAGSIRDSELDRAVVLGFDGVYDGAGRLDLARSQMVVPDGWVFEVCRVHPDALLPAPSISPNRRDAMESLEAAIDAGAVLIKWLPSAQGIDPSSPRHAPFYRRLADARLPLLIHAGGGEQTFAEIAPEFGRVAHLRVPLEAGVTVVCAHSGAPVVLSRRPDETPLLRELLTRFPDLWVDNSGMANPSRFPSLPRSVDDPRVRERTLHGSDYPIPSSAIYYPRRLGLKRVREIERVANVFDRDVSLKRALGYPDATLTRASSVLANLDRWR